MLTTFGTHTPSKTAKNIMLLVTLCYMEAYKGRAQRINGIGTSQTDD